MKLSHHLFTILLSLALPSYAAEFVYSPVESPVPYNSLTQLPTGDPTGRIVYGTDKALQYGQLWLPNKSQLSNNQLIPAIIFIHGGCWLNEYTIDHTNAVSTALVQAGYIVWSLEYRRVGDAGGGWPGTFEDIAQGIDWIRRLAVDFPIDTNRVIFMGHSAGGHLALWAAGRSQMDAANPFYRQDAVVPKAVMALAPITNLQDYAAMEGSCNEAVVPLIGGSYAEFSKRYDVANPNPVFRSPMVVNIVRGDADTIIPASQIQTFLAQATGDVFGHEIPKAGHFDLIHPGTQAWQKIMGLLMPSLNYPGE